MKISVITVCFNASNLIERTIKSVINQENAVFEYIIIDGGSTDGTTKIIRKFEKQITHWISEKDNGIYDAMNKGIVAASGDYIIFMNAGDKFSNNHILASVSNSLGNHTIVSGRWNRCYSDGKVKLASPKSLNSFWVEMPICHQATFIKLDYHKNNPFDISFRLSADYNFFYNAWKNNESFSYIEDVIVDFLEAEGASTDNITTSVMEREKAWKGEKNIFLRKLNLKYQIYRIKSIKLLKSIISNLK